MCGDAIVDIVGADDFAIFVADHDVVFAPTGGLIPAPILVEVSRPDYSKLDNDDVTKANTRLKKLEEKGYKTNPASVIEDDLSQVTFEDVFARIHPASDVVAPFAENWTPIGAAIAEATQTFRLELGRLEQAGAWKGATHDAAINNVESSFPEPTTAAEGADAMGFLTEAFNNTIRATKDNIERNWASYQDALNDYPEHHDQIKQAYNTFAQSVMRDVYTPNIDQIARNNLVFTAGGPPPVGPGQNGLPGGPGSFGAAGGGPGSFGGGGPGSFGGGMPKSFGGPGPLDTPKFGTFDDPALADTPPDGPTGPGPSPTPPTPGPGGLGDPLKGASDAARNAAGQAADAAKKAAQGTQNPHLPKTGGPPEGVLGLGPKGLGGSPAGGGPGAQSGGPGGAGPRELAQARPPSAPSTAPAKPGSVAAAPGAGLGAMGPPGAGAPAAGQRGDANAKGHQVNKALKSKKTGEQITGEADAVVPVIGAPDKPANAEPDPAEQFGEGMPPVARGLDRVEQAIQVPGL